MSASLPQFASEALDLCNEIKVLAHVAAGFEGLIRRAADQGHPTIYNSVRYGLEIDRLLRACSKLLHVVVELNQMQPPLGGESKR